MTDAVIIITHLPDRELALKLSRALVERHLAACASVLAPCTSVYRWQDRIEETAEVPLLIKTRSGLYGEVEAIIREFHPYELPDIIAIPAEHVLPQYLEWLIAETTIAIE